jgi:uncharacterized protein (DUF4415 family)/uncharacterized DUF497 family protein
MYNEMLFEWDAEKNRSNQKKHSGVDFETASRVFADPDLMLRKDRVIDGEQQWHAIGGVCRAVLLVVHVYLEEKPNGEKQSGSSQPAKPIRVSADSIWSKPPGKRQKAVLDKIAKSQAHGGDAHIDYSDIPALSQKQLAQFKRTPKKLVAVRLDADVFEWIRQFGAGYSTRINSVLRAVMSQQR